MRTKKPKPMAAGHPDNFQTPPYALDCVIPSLRASLPRDPVIWEPSCGKGNIARKLYDSGFRVWDTDILSGQDFLTHEPEVAYDCILTNPPFSIKEKFLARCYALGKPFALLMPLTTFDSKERRRLFDRHGIEVIFPDRRINFETPNGTGSSAWFYTCWFTWGFGLPHQLNFQNDDKQLDLMGAA